jgi:hypothetical protein
MAPRDRLLAEAARFLTTLLGASPGEVEVTVRSADLKDGYTLRGPPPPNAAEVPPPPEGYPPGVRWLSPTAEVILGAMPSGQLISAAKLAEELGDRLTVRKNELYPILNDLADRGFLEGGTHGYRKLF